MRGPSVLVFVAFVTACGGGAPQDKNVGGQTADIAADNQTLREANEATGDLVRAAGDCDAVKAALPGAQQRLEQIATRVRTETGRVSLEALRKRVREIGESCP